MQTNNLQLPPGTSYKDFLDQLLGFVVENISEQVSEKVFEKLQAHQQANKEDKWLTSKEVRAKLGISNPTLDAYCKAGTINKHYIGSKVRFKESQIDDALKTFRKYRRPIN